MALGVQVLLPEGDPNGIKHLAVSGWSGRAFIIPRGKLRDIKGRPEASQPAIYFLFGTDEESDKQFVYIGESESFYARLSSHDDHKDFWNTAVVFTGGINRAFVKYFENKSIQLAKVAHRYEMVNRVEPIENHLSEFERVEADDFFEKMKLTLDLFGFPIFQEVPSKKAEGDLYYFVTDKASATGRFLDSGEFIVYKGSTARIRESDSFIGFGGSLSRARLMQQGILMKIDEESFVYTADHIYRSPSAAGDAVAARSVNGWTSWKDLKGNSLDENMRK